MAKSVPSRKREAGQGRQLHYLTSTDGTGTQHVCLSPEQWRAGGKLSQSKLRKRCLNYSLLAAYNDCVRLVDVCVRE